MSRTTSQHDHDHDHEPDPHTAAVIPHGKSFLFHQVHRSGSDIRITPATDPSTVLYEVRFHMSLDRRNPKLSLLSEGHPIAHLFHHWTTGYKIGVDRGGSGDESRMRWVQVQRGGLTGLTKRYSVEWEGGVYLMARMRGAERNQGRSAGYRHGNYKVVAQGSGEVVATFLAEGSLRAGILTLHPDLAADLAVIVVAAVAEWRQVALKQLRTAGGVVA